MSNPRYIAQELEKQFNLTNRDLNLMYILLSSLQPGETISTLCGSYTKRDGQTIQLIPNDSMINQLVNDLVPQYDIE